MIDRVFLDVDGVLAWWNKAAHEVHGLTFKHDIWPYSRGVEGWDWNKDAKVQLTTAELFAPMGFEFWRDLEWIPQGLTIYSYLINRYRDRLYLLTSPAMTKGAVDGRLAWIQREIPEMRKRTIICSCKEACAGPGKVLIDDSSANARAFIEAGGEAILIPRPYNELEYMGDDVDLKYWVDMNMNLLERKYG